MAVALLRVLLLLFAKRKEGLLRWQRLLPLQGQDNNLRPVEQSKCVPGISQSPGNKQIRLVGAVKSRRVGGKQVSLHTYEAIGKRQADQSPLYMSGNHKIRSMTAISVL